MGWKELNIFGFPTSSTRTHDRFEMTVTTTGAQTLTLQSLDVASGKTVRVTWGDGSYTDYTGTGTRTHAYSGAGTWTVTITPPGSITKIDFRDTKITLNHSLANCTAVTSLAIYNVSGFNSAYIADMPLTSLTLYLEVAGTYTFDSGHISSMPLTYLYMRLSAAGTYTFDSSHISSMALTYLYLRLYAAGTYTFNSSHIGSMPLTTLDLYLPAAGTYTFNSSHIGSMALTILSLHLPAAGTYTFNSSHISSMALTYLYLYLDAAGTYTFDSSHISSMALTYLYLYLDAASTTTTIARADWGGVVLRGAQYSTIQMGLDATEVSNVLLGIYDMVSSGARTATGGTLNVAGSNAAPSGVLQAACPPTTGKEAAYELVNDTCNVIPAGEEYAAVTINN